VNFCVLSWYRPGSDVTAFPAQLLQPPSSHSPVLRKTNSQPHPAETKSLGPSTKGDGKRQASPPSTGGYHPRAQSIPTGSVAGSGSSGDAAIVAARADRLKADDHKSRSKSGSPRQVVDYWSTLQQPLSWYICISLLLFDFAVVKLPTSTSLTRRLRAVLRCSRLAGLAAHRFTCCPQIYSPRTHIDHFLRLFLFFVADRTACSHRHVMLCVVAKRYTL